MKLLIVEDNITTMQILVAHLEDDFDVIECENGKKGLEQIKTLKPEIVILDVNLPDMNGMEICKIIKSDEEIYGIPKIIMLTGETEQKSVVKGLKTGANDYIKKPFDIEELLLRIENITKDIPDNNNIEYKGLLLNYDEQTLYFNGELEKSLSKLQYDLLYYLILNKGLYLSKDKIYENVWGDFRDEDNRAVDQCIKKIRKRFDIIKENLETKKGFGYRLKK